MYDPILRARRDALARVQEEITTTYKEYDKIERAIDIFIDCIEDELAGHSLVVTCDEYDSNS